MYLKKSGIVLATACVMRYKYIFMEVFIMFDDIRECSECGRNAMYESHEESTPCEHGDYSEDIYIVWICEYCGHKEQEYDRCEG